MSAVLEAYRRVLRARWRWLAWGVLLMLAATTAVLILRPPLYRSTASVFVRTPGDVSRVVDGGDSYAQARAETFAALATSTSVTSRVVADLGLTLTPEALSERIQATHQGGTALMKVEVSAPSAAEAQRTATVLLTELSTTVYLLESVPGSLVPRSELVVVDPPSQPTRILAWGMPVWLMLLGSTLIGLVLGAIGAVLRSLGEPPVLDGQPVGDAGLEASTSTSDPPPSDCSPAETNHGKHRAARQLAANADEGNE